MKSASNTLTTGLRRFAFGLGLAASITVVLSFSSASRADQSLTDYAFDTDQIERYLESCQGLPTDSEMRAEIGKMLQTYSPSTKRLNEILTPTRYEQAFVEWIFPRDPRKKVNVLLDGLHLEQIDRRELDVLAALTDLNVDGAAVRNSVVKMDFRNREWLSIRRWCGSADCTTYGLRKGHDLSRFNKGPNCETALCAADRLYGPDQGALIVWAYLKYGMRMGSYVSPLAEPSGFEFETAWMLVTAAHATPKHLHAVALQDARFFQYRKGQTLQVYGERRPVANASGMVFDPISRYTIYQRLGIFLHELGHRVTISNDLDRNPQWDAIAKQGAVSIYGLTNSLEDFAETFAQYRINPAKLKAASPARYTYMKTRVFQGLEYTSDLCHGR